MRKIKRVGLFIGIDKYSNGVSRLEFAKNDADKLSDCFKGKGYEVERLLNEEVTYNGILKKINEIKGGLESGDLFVLYFAGHGVEIAGRHCLLCADADDQMDTLKGKMPLQDLIRYSAKTGIHRLFILDSCRRELLAGDRSGVFACPKTRDLSLRKIGDDHSHPEILPPLIITSCSQGERAYEYAAKRRGIFTWVLEEVLNDSANPVRDVSSLVDRINMLMKLSMRHNRTQHLSLWGNPMLMVPLFAEWERPAPTPAPTREPTTKPQTDAEKSSPAETKHLFRKILLCTLIIAGVIEVVCAILIFAPSPSEPAPAPLPPLSAPPAKTAETHPAPAKTAETPAAPAKTAETAAKSPTKPAVIPAEAKKESKEALHARLAHELFESGRKKLTNLKPEEAIADFMKILQLEYAPKKLHDSARQHIDAIKFKDESGEEITVAD